MLGIAKFRLREIAGLCRTAGMKGVLIAAAPESGRDVLALVAPGGVGVFVLML
jgi:hypothetical protein